MVFGQVLMEKIEVFYIVVAKPFEYSSRRASSIYLSFNLEKAFLVSRLFSRVFRCSLSFLDSSTRAENWLLSDSFSIERDSTLDFATTYFSL